MYHSHQLRPANRISHARGDWMSRLALPAIFALLCSIAIQQTIRPAVRAVEPGGASADAARAKLAAARPRLMFVENMGQFAAGERYVLEDGPATLALAQDALWLTIHARQPDASTPDAPPIDSVQLKLSFAGANPRPRLEPIERADTHVAYFTGADQSAWRTNVPAWRGVRYGELYPGVDLELRDAGGRLAIRAIARPGADLQSVRLRVEGADDLALAGDQVLLRTALGAYALPLIEVAADRAGLPAADLAPHRSGAEIARPFASGAPAGPVTPQAAGDLIYSTLFGGSGVDESDAIALDASGAAYIVGYTASGNFPLKPGAVSYRPSGSNATVVKVNPNGSDLDYIVVIGGGGIEYGTGIAVDSAGNAYVAGYTASSDFPTVNGYDNSGAGVDKDHRDGFIFKLNPTASALIYSTYFGGSGTETVEDLAIDAANAVYITGRTDSTNLPTTAGAYDQTQNGGDDIYVAKLAPSGASRDYVTYIGGIGIDRAFGIEVDASGAAYVAGRSDSFDFPTVNAYDSSWNGLEDAIVAKLNPTGTDLVYSTYLGGSGIDRALSMAVDASGAAYVAGFTSSDLFPTTAGAFDTSYNGGEDAFVAKLGASGASLLYATYLGGTGDDEGRGIVVNSAGEAHVIGFTKSNLFPTTAGAYDTSFNGNTDIFIAKLTSSGAGLLYGSFFGGADLDSGDAIARDRSDFVYLTGVAGQTGFPTLPGAYNTSHNGGASDAFAAKLRVGAVVAPRYTISGRVLDEQGTPVANVTISAGGQNVLTDNNGDYKLVDLPAGGYRITPSKVDHTFDPLWLDVNLAADMTVPNFTDITPRYRVSGKVITKADGAGLAGVQISDGKGDTTTTAADGGYSLLLPAGNYTLTPSRSGYKFEPTARSVFVVNADTIVPNFSAIPTSNLTTNSTLFVPMVRRGVGVVYCDGYEPNNNRYVNPAPIKIGETIVAKICQDEGLPQPDTLYQDNYSLSTTQPAPLKITLRLPPTLIGHVGIVVYSGEELGKEISGCYKDVVRSNPFPMTCTIPDSGTYIVRLFSADKRFDNSQTYTLLVTQ